MKFFDLSDKKLIFLLVCLGNIAISFNIGAVAAAVPVIAEDLGKPDFLVARIVAYYMIPYGIGALLYAPLVRYLNYRIVSMVAMAIFAVMSLVSALSGSLDSILLAQIGGGIAAASSTPLSLMIIGNFFERDIRGRLVGWYFGCSFFASVVGLLFMGTIHWRWLFIIPAILAAVVAVSLFFLKSSLIDKTHDESVNYFKALWKSDIRRIFIFIFAMSFLYHAVHKWYGVYLTHEYLLDKKTVSWILIFGALSGLAGQQIGGYLSDKKGRVATCRIGMIILGIAVGLLSFHYTVILVPVIIGLVSIGWTISHNSISTILTDFPDENRPIMASLNSSVRFISGGLGFSLSRLLVEKSFAYTFLGIGVVVLLMVLFIQDFVSDNK